MWDELLSAQDGVFSRGQALAAGLTPATIRANVSAGRWRRLFTGVYAAFTGPPPRRAQLWAAVLRAGSGAVLSHHTAAELHGLVDRPSAAIHVMVPESRTPSSVPGLVVHRSAHVGLARHPSRTPPQTRVEETVLDLVQVARCLDEAMGWLARAVGRD